MADYQGKFTGAEVDRRLTAVESLSALEPDLKHGKQKLAQAITAKGVPTAEDASMQTMAENVRNIAQESYELQGDKIYEQQMFGSETISPEPYKQNGPLWNLYKVMTDLLSDGRFTNYGGILLAEYYKEYDTIELMGAGAGGAYFTCDGDFYTTDKVGENAHVWHDTYDGMANRWVAYLFAAPDSNYTIPSTNLCPRSIHIGRSVGTIYNNTVGRISEIVVTDGNTLGDIAFNENVENWGRNIVIRNIREHREKYIIALGSQLVTSVVLGIKKSSSPVYYMSDGIRYSGRTVFVFDELLESYGTLLHTRYGDLVFNIYAPKLTTIGGNGYFINTQYNDAILSEILYFPSLVSAGDSFSGGYFDYLIDMEVGAMNTSLNMRKWRANNIIANPIQLAQLNANIREHIAAKVSDRTGQTALTFTVSTNLYNNLEQATKDAFTAKNWRVAGA